MGDTMKSGLSAYFDLMFKNMDCYATWLPGTPVEVGEIGRVAEQGSFVHSGYLSERASLPPTHTRNYPPQTVSTTGSVKFSAGGDVETEQVIQALANANASVDVTFTDSEAAALLLQDASITEFTDEQPVREVMQSLLASGKIAPDEVVVTYVIEARSGVVATSYTAERDTNVKVSAEIGQGAIKVANVGGHLQVVSQQGSQTFASAVPGTPLTPMYRALAFRSNRKWWSFWRSTLGIASVVDTRSFGDEDPTDVLTARPSRAVPESDNESVS